MSKRLQVLVSDGEYNLFKEMASRNKLTVGEWVRRSLRKSAKETSTKTVAEKLKAIREASRYSFPTGDIEQINAEIEQGYLSGLR